MGGRQGGQRGVQGKLMTRRLTFHSDLPTSPEVCTPDGVSIRVTPSRLPPAS